MASVSKLTWYGITPLKQNSTVKLTSLLDFKHLQVPLLGAKPEWGEPILGQGLCLAGSQRSADNSHTLKERKRSCSVVPNSLQPYALAHQAPLSMVILQARILKWVAISFSKGSSQPRDRTQLSHIAGGLFTLWATRDTLKGSPIAAKLQTRVTKCHCFFYLQPFY